MKREMSEEGNGMEIIDREMAPFFPAIIILPHYSLTGKDMAEEREIDKRYIRSHSLLSLALSSLCRVFSFVHNSFLPSKTHDGREKGRTGTK